MPSRPENPDPPPPDPRTPGLPVLFPALLIGLGGTGLRVLLHLRRVLRARFGSLEAVPHLHWLYADTDPDGLGRALEAPPAFALLPADVLLLRLNRANHYLRARGSQVPIESWFNPKMLYRIPRNQLTAGIRALGRLALVDGYRPLAERLRANLRACRDPVLLESARAHTGLGIAGDRPRVYVVASLAGGTGSGMFLDIGYLVREFCRQLDLESAESVALLLVPPVESGPDRLMAVGNTYAALTELHHFSTPGATFSAWYEYDSPGLSSRGSPFGRVTLAALTPETEEGPPRWLGLAGDYLLQDLVTPLGQATDQYWARSRPASSGGALSYRTFGIYRFTWPRASLVEQTSRQLSRQIVEHWIARGASTELAAAARTRFHELLAENRFGLEGVVATLDAACATVLGKAPTVFFDSVTEGLVAQGPAAVDGPAATEALRQLEQMVGLPEGTRRGSRSSLSLLPTPPPSALHAPLDEATRNVSRLWHGKLLQLTFSLLDQPVFRLAGVEVAVALVGPVVAELIQISEQSVPPLHFRAAEAYERARAGLGSLTGFGSWFRSKTAAVTDLLESLRLYPRLRYHALLVERASNVGRYLLTTAPEFAHDFNICRGRLSDFLRTLPDPFAARSPEVERSPGRELYPPGCRDRKEALAQLLERLTPAELLRFDQQIQQFIQKDFTSLWQVCVAPSSNVFEDLERVLEQQALVFVENILEGIDAADFYLRTHPDEAQIVQEIAEAFAEAAPDLTRHRRQPPEEMYLVAAPPGPAADQFDALARRALAGAELVMAVSKDAIIFYREQAGKTFGDLEQLGSAAREAYRQLTATDAFTPHSRMDVTDWTPVETDGDRS